MRRWSGRAGPISCANCVSCRRGAVRPTFPSRSREHPPATGFPRGVRGRASAVGGRRAPTPGSEAGLNAGELKARCAGFSGPFGCAFPNQADRGAPRAGVRRWSAAAIRERRSDGSVSSRAKPGDTSTGRAVSSAAWRGNGWIGGATTKRALAWRHGRTWTRGAGPGRRKHNRQGQRGGASTACRGGGRSAHPPRRRGFSGSISKRLDGAAPAGFRIRRSRVAGAMRPIRRRTRQPLSTLLGPSSPAHRGPV